MLMNHAKWIYDYIDPGTYCVVTKGHRTDSELRSVLKTYVPPLGYDMLPDRGPGDNSKGLTPSDYVVNPEILEAPT